MEPAEKQRRFTIRSCLRLIRKAFALTGVLLLVAAIGFGLYAWRINSLGDAAVARVETMLDERGLLNLYPDHLKNLANDPSDNNETAALL